MKSLPIILVLALSLALAACDFDGGVEQGRCVAYDPDAGTVTIVVDTTLDQHDPHYSGQVDTFKLPTDPRDMGPAPVAGGRLMLEIDKNMILYYDRETKSVKELPVQFTEVEKGISAKHPKIYDDKDKKKKKKFPIIDKENHTITVYSPRLESLVTFRVSDAELDMPAYTWEAGDEVRIAFRKSKRNDAIRFMNVSKTSIFTR